MPDQAEPSTLPAETTAASEGEACPTLVEAVQASADLRTLAMMGLLLLAVLYTLYLAKPFLLPVVLAMLFSLLLRPIVRAMARVRIPEAAGAAVVVLGLLGLLIAAVYGLSGPAAAWVRDAPNMAGRIEAKLRPLMRPVEQVNEATAAVEEKIQGESETPEVTIKQPGFSDTILSQAGSFIAVATVVIILVYFLLASGDLFLRKLVKVLPNFREKKRAIEIAQKTQEGVSKYLVTVSLIYTGLGVAVAVAMFLLGMPNPILWGVVAGLLNFIPYLGAMITLVILTAVAILSFDSLGYALLVPAVFLTITTIEGYIVTPTIVGKRLTLNPVVVFVGMTFWWWVWGIAGALLAVPLIAVLKILCENIEPLNPVAEFLGE